MSIEHPDGGPEEGQLDLNALLSQAMQMKDQLESAQASAAAEVVEGQAGGGLVKVTVSGSMDFRSVTIEPDAWDPDDVTVLEDLILAAIHDAVAQVSTLNQSTLGNLGLDLGPSGLSGLLGS